MSKITWLVSKAIVMISLYRSRIRWRRELANLSDHMLQDIGMTREQAIAEASKPFWKS